jgi:hypothetical protein
MTHGSHEAVAAFSGLDWADANHAVCLHAAGTAHREFLRLAHSPEAMNAWGQTLRTRFHGQPVAVCLERTTGPLVSALRTDDCLGLFPVHPLPVATSREALTPSRAQDDPPAAALQVALLLTHRDQLTPLSPQSPTRRALAHLVAQRQRLVGDPVRLPHRVPRALKNSFPRGLRGLQDKDPGLFGDVLSRWPTRTAAHLARRTPLERFCRAHHVHAADGITTRLEALKSAVALTTDEGGITPNALLVQALVAPLRLTLQVIADFDHAMAQRAQEPPDCAWLDALPGAGAVFAPRRLVAFGAQRERDASAAALQKEAGMAPVTERSGKQSWGHWRLQCPKLLRQTVVEWAAASTRHAFWAQVYSQPQRAKGKAHQAAVRALACTWMRILYRCWQDRTPYDASVYLQALNRRSAPLLHNLAHEVCKGVKKP